MSEKCNMKRIRWVIIPILFILACSMLPLAFTGPVQAGEGKSNLAELTSGADSVIVGTVVERSSYWNDEHTGIYTSAVLSIEEELKGTVGRDRITVTLPGGEADGIGQWVSDVPSFDRGEKAVVFLKKLSTEQLPKTKAYKAQLPEEQFEVYRGYQGKFAIKQGKVGSLPESKFKERVRKVTQGQILPEGELYVPLSTATFPYSYSGYCWPHPPDPVVGYRINENTADCSGEGAAVQTAAATWNGAGARFAFSYAGASAATAYSYNGSNEILWKGLGSGGTIARAIIWYSGSTILENDIEFNDYYIWSAAASCPGGQFDVETIALHELGHWLCLNDLYDAADAAKVMYGYGSSGQTKRTLHADDIAGIQYIYGASTTAPTVTNSTGASNVTTTSARLNGELTSTGGATTTVHICWGDNDGGTGTWDHDENLGVKSTGAFYFDASGLTNGTTYYYRCYATNSTGTSWAASSSSFVAQSNQKLLGADDITQLGNDAPNYFLLTKFTAVASGQVTEFRVKGGTLGGNVKVAIYADNGGEPGALLNANNTGQAVTANQWNTLTIPATDVTSGNTYWLAINMDAGCIGYAQGSPGSYKYKRATYSTFTFPNPADTGLSTSSWRNIIAGWGTLGSPPPPAAPTVTNSTGASNITSTSARLNGKLTSTGGATTTVHICWGDNDGGTGAWDTDVDLGTLGTGAFYTDISSLTNGQTYFYRCYATNSTGTSWAASSSSFVAQNTNKLIGANDTTASGNDGANYFILTRWTATGSGNVSQIRIKCGASGSVKVAIYSDASGTPGSLLGANNSGQAVSSGWNTINLSSPASISSGTNYWLAFVSSTNCVNYVSGGGTYRWNAATYSTFSFPATAGSGFSSYNGYIVSQGWGAPPLPPDAAPALISPGASITFKWGTAERATTYWLQVNTQSDFNGTDVFNSELGNVTEHEVTGLLLGTTYYWRVRSGNDAGWGNWSSVRSVLANTVP